PGQEVRPDPKLFTHALEAWMSESHRSDPLPDLRSGPGVFKEDLLARVDENLGIFNGSIRLNSVTKIEDVTVAGERTSGFLGYDPKLLWWAEQNGRIHIALQRDP